jgi:hypothetical protein
MHEGFGVSCLTQRLRPDTKDHRFLDAAGLSLLRGNALNRAALGPADLDHWVEASRLG